MLKTNRRGRGGARREERNKRVCIPPGKIYPLFLIFTHKIAILDRADKSGAHEFTGLLKIFEKG
jgi:hypothetical protein